MQCFLAFAHTMALRDWSRNVIQQGRAIRNEYSFFFLLDLLSLFVRSLATPAAPAAASYSAAPAAAAAPARQADPSKVWVGRFNGSLTGEFSLLILFSEWATT